MILICFLHDFDSKFHMFDNIRYGFDDFCMILICFYMILTVGIKTTTNVGIYMTINVGISMITNVAVIQVPSANGHATRVDQPLPALESLLDSEKRGSEDPGGPGEIRRGAIAAA